MGGRGGTLPFLNACGPWGSPALQTTRPDILLVKQIYVCILESTTMEEPPAPMTELDQIKFKMNATTDEVST